MKTYFLVIVMLISVSAFADKVIIANCSEGVGCTFELSDFESELFENDFGRKIQPDDIVVLGKKKSGDYINYLDKKSRAAIDKEWGGDGYTQLGLFNPKIQPLDGEWKIDFGTSTGSECYGVGNLGAAFRKNLRPGNAGSGNIHFQFPFNPSQLFPSSDMQWRKTGYNTYKGLLDLGSNNIAGMKMYYNVTIVSNKKIETVYHVEIKVPTKGTCIAKIPVKFTLLKAEELEDFTDNYNPDDDLLPVNPKGNKEDDLLPVNPKGGKKEDDLMEVKPKGNKDDLLPVNSKKDDLLPIEPGKKPKAKVERIEADVERIND